MEEEHYPISFYSENTDFELSNEAETREWLLKAVAAEKHTLQELSIIFCDDEYLQEMNQEYLEHEELTDIITFQYHEEGQEVHGDLFISIERVRENAELFKVTFEHELNRVMVHGTLHLMGYKDKTPADKSLMTEKENHYLDARR